MGGQLGGHIPVCGQYIPGEGSDWQLGWFRRRMVPVPLQKRGGGGPAGALSQKGRVQFMEDKKEMKTQEEIAGYQKGAYVKEVPDFRMDDNKSDVTIMKEFYTLIYGFLAQRVIDSFGAEGDQVVRRALRDFGRYRGLAHRERMLHYGLELNMRNLHVYSDLPGDEDQETCRQIFEKDDFYSDLTECDMFDLWKKYDLMDAAVAYCEEMHHAMWSAFHEDTVVVQDKILTRGDEKCTFRCRMPNYQKKKDLESYKKGFKY